MSQIPWGIEKNLENSLVDFLTDEFTGKTVFLKGANQSIDIRVGNAYQDNWSMPCISIYADTETDDKPFIGNNVLLKSHLMIIDIRATDGGMRSDLKDYLVDIISNGFPYYEYNPNPGEPDESNKALVGKASIKFISNVPIRNTQDSNYVEKFRQQITINVTIASA